MSDASDHEIIEALSGSGLGVVVEVPSVVVIPNSE